MSRLRLVPAAKADLDLIWTSSTERWGIDQAESYIRLLGQTLRSLAETPGLGRAVEDVRPGYFKFPNASHVIFYRKTSAGIEVIRILHKSMDVDRHL